MFIKALFDSLKTTAFKPYVVYIDNPGTKLSELIGDVISQVGIENFRRYLWSIFLEFMDTKDNEDPEGRSKKEILMKELDSLKVNVPDLFKQTINNEDVEFSWDQLTVSYKYLINKISYSARLSDRKQIEVLFKKYLTDCYAFKFKISSVAEYFL